MPSPEKFNETLGVFAVPAHIQKKIYEGYGELCSKTPKKVKAAFFRQAITVMNENLPPAQVQEILEANACCKSGARERNSKEFSRIYKDLKIAERLKLINACPYLNMGSAELDGKGNLVVYAVAYKLGEKFECACPTVSKIKRDYRIPREYCFCCGGHFKYHYEIMLDVKLELAEIVSSPHDTEGSKPCVFRYRIL